MKLEVKNKQVSVEIPNQCPHCHFAMAPEHESTKNFSSDYSNTDYVISWRCTNDPCQKLIVAHYYWNGSYNLNVSKYLDGFSKGPDWPEPILKLKSKITKEGKEKEIDSRFIQIYLESLKAEDMGLHEIAGMGYRKAIEFLVKDWAISNNQDDSDTIKQAWLSKVIKDYYTGDLKDILERATWLGNDQTHYKKLLEEYNTSDLKQLIELIMAELDRDYKKTKYITEIEKRK